MPNFKHIYETASAEQPVYMISSHFADTPLTINKILPPQSAICVQPVFDLQFVIDKQGMDTFVDMFQEVWDEKTEKAKSNFVSILTDIYNTTEEYLGGRGVEIARREIYLNAKDGKVRLSEIQGRRVGICAERATLAHQMISILEKAGLINYESVLTNTHITTSKKEPHSLILLKNKKDPSKIFLFDIENPLQYQKGDNPRLATGVALYPLTETQYRDFMDGKAISPQSIYEQAGMQVFGEQRFYGESEVVSADSGCDLC